VCHLGFVENEERGEIERAWPRAKVRWDDAFAREMAAQVFQMGQRADLKALVRGTQFQVRVWRALLKVPPGAVVSYGHLAAAIGQPSAARAVGTAVGSNPLAFLIPCHRVIRETGVMGQYRWGWERKRALLGWEGARRR
jgi:AraC family transcriptional regulator of adaptative response/methylated-DNA-[protein]-cysteine methyltransferase